MLKDKVDLVEEGYLNKYYNAEDRQDENKYHVWHTFKEDSRGCDVASYIIHHFEGFNMLEVKYIKERLKDFKTEGLLSVPVFHDKVNVNVKLLDGYSDMLK